MNELNIREILPHREPFLFIDNVSSISLQKDIIAYRKFKEDEYFFKGHFPGNPVVPGVILIESLAQAGGILVYESFKENLKGKLPALAGLNNVKFRKPVRPNDVVMLKVELLKSRSILWKLGGQAFVGSDLVAEAEITASVF